MASADEGFGQGCGLVFGALVAIALVIGGLVALNKVAEPCQVCNSSGKCRTCGGNGKGILWGDCMTCNGQKSCRACNGSGWKSK